MDTSKLKGGSMIDIDIMDAAMAKVIMEADALERPIYIKMRTKVKEILLAKISEQLDEMNREAEEFKKAYVDQGIEDFMKSRGMK
jgi:hypothetical protein